MARPGKVDYHVHYHVDGCAHDEMTLANIAAEATRLGLDEIAVLKHYTSALPNGEGEWVYWKRVRPEQFEAYLADIRSFEPPESLRILAGTESEILDDAGTIAIPPADQEKLDAVVLTVHWLPTMESLPAGAALLAGGPGGADATDAAQWQRIAAGLDARAVLENYVAAYVRAIEANPRVRVLGHMGDGLGPLRAAGIDLDAVEVDACVRCMEPLMRACASHRVLWELTEAAVAAPAILRRADRLGVRFSATADAHCLAAGTWGYLRDRHRAEARIDEYGLTRGVICLDTDPHAP